MSDLFGVCVDPPGNCPSCPGTGQNGVTINQPQFGASGTRTASACCSKAVSGGLMNVKNSRTSASSFTILKKSISTIQPYAMNKELPANINEGTPANSYTNTGGPGDSIKSVPIITSAKSGWRARLIAQPNQTGVDVKHNSYERYLARKRGWVMRCQNC